MGEAVITCGVTHDQGFVCPLDVSHDRGRHRALWLATANRKSSPSPFDVGSSQACRSSLHTGRWTSVEPLIALSTSTTRECSRSMLVSELSAPDAERIPSRSIVPVVTVDWRAERPSDCSGERSPVALRFTCAGACAQSSWATSTAAPQARYPSRA